MFIRRVDGFWEEAENEATLADFRDPTGGRENQERRMTSGGVAKDALFKIKKEIRCGDEMILELATQGAI